MLHCNRNAWHTETSIVLGLQAMSSHALWSGHGYASESMLRYERAAVRQGIRGGLCGCFGARHAGISISSIWFCWFLLWLVFCVFVGRPLFLLSVNEEVHDTTQLGSSLDFMSAFRIKCALTGCFHFMQLLIIGQARNFCENIMII